MKQTQTVCRLLANKADARRRRPDVGFCGRSGPSDFMSTRPVSGPDRRLYAAPLLGSGHAVRGCKQGNLFLSEVPLLAFAVSRANRSQPAKLRNLPRHNS
jgi:hypothetical protein